MKSPKPIVFSDKDWQSSTSLPLNYQRHTCVHKSVSSNIEKLTFKEDFHLVRQSLKTDTPLWHPAFHDLDYIGFCFAFTDAKHTDLSMPYLYHEKMNITSGYEFKGGICHAVNNHKHYVSLQFSYQYFKNLSQQYSLPKWLNKLINSKGYIASIEVPARLRNQAWKILNIPPAIGLSQRLQIESLALDWLASCLLITDVRTSQHKKYVDEAIDIIENEYFESLSIASLAKRVGINDCDLKRQFKKQTGLSIHQYVIQHRLSLAQRYLRKRPELSISIIANLCGYQPSHFSATFKRIHGMTPRQWRENNLL